MSITLVCFGLPLALIGPPLYLIATRDQRRGKVGKLKGRIFRCLYAGLAIFGMLSLATGGLMALIGA